MEDLYGDLPPPSHETANTALSKPEIGNSWIALNPVTSKHAEASSKGHKTQQLQAQSEVNLTKNKQTTTSSRFVPSTVLFKPRQTAVPTSSTPALSSSSSSNNGLVANSSSLSHRTGKPNNTSETSPSSTVEPSVAIPPTDVHIVIAKTTEFNPNNSFDVDNPYDPRRPNDYHQYCNKREEEKRLAALAVDNKRKLEEMERARADVERQRKIALERGDYQTLLSTSLTDSSGLGRGRGRGVANLPSWIVEQMKQDESKEVKSDSTLPGQFNDAQSATPQEEAPNLPQNRKVSHFSKPSNVILLKNMVSATDVDSSLASETKMECQKFGRVLSCEIYILDKNRFPTITDTEQVRVFVQFERQESAVKAFK
jgi:hypothetical protein